MVLVADSLKRTDGLAYRMLQLFNSELPLVLVSWVDNFSFNGELLKLEKFKYILFDFCEFGWEWDGENGHLFGSGTEHKHQKFKTDEWKKFDEFVTLNPPLKYFCRELTKTDASEYYLPIEYPSFFYPQLQSKEDYEKRPLEVFFNWGLSNPIRPIFHGNIWKYSDKYGYIVCDSFNNLNGFIVHESNPKKWLTVNTPHYSRMPIEEVLKVNSLSKLSLSLWGAGKKCFRSSESPLNSVMVLLDDNLEWTHKWDHGFNCLRLPSFSYPLDKLVEFINESLGRKDLYDIYSNGVETVKKYSINEYVFHIEKLINQ
jgi:hypothetical protein